MHVGRVSPLTLLPEERIGPEQPDGRERQPIKAGDPELTGGDPLGDPGGGERSGPLADALRGEPLPNVLEQRRDVRRVGRRRQGDIESGGLGELSGANHCTVSLGGAL